MINVQNNSNTHTHLHGADAETAMDDELAQGRRALVAVASVNHEQSAQVLELSDGEIRSQRRLLPFLKHRHTQTHSHLTDHGF